MAKRHEPVNVGRRAVDLGAPPRVVEVETDEARRASEAQSKRLREFRDRFGPLRGDVKR